MVSGPVAQEKQAIWVISVISATLKKLRDDAFDASLSRDGLQIVYRDAVSEDIWLMDSSGAGAKLLIKPEDGYHVAEPTWFPNDKRIAYLKYQVKNGNVTAVLESRDIKGNNPISLLSNPRFNDFCWGQHGRLVYSVHEAPPSQYDANLWELRFDEETGKPKGDPRRLTDWTGFSFDYPQLTLDEKRFVFLNQKAQSAVYVAELASKGNELKTPQRLTLDERLDWPGGWSRDSKTVFLYSNRNGSFDIYKQGVNERDAQSLATSSEEKWAPQISSDGKWLLYMQWLKAAEGTSLGSGKLMRVPLGGSPSEVVMDIKGRPGNPSSSNPLDTVGGFPSFRCPLHAGANCVLAEADDTQIVFSSFDPVQGRKAELVKLPTIPGRTSWDLSPDGSGIAVSLFSYKAADLQIVPLAGGSPQKLSAMPWTELAAVAWAADGKSLFLASYSSRGTGIVHMEFTGKSKLLFKPHWDVFSLAPSPDGHYLAFGPVITNSNAWSIASFPAK